MIVATIITEGENTDSPHFWRRRFDIFYYNLRELEEWENRFLSYVLDIYGKIPRHLPPYYEYVTSFCSKCGQILSFRHETFYEAMHIIGNESNWDYLYYFYYDDDGTPYAIFNLGTNNWKLQIYPDYVTVTRPNGTTFTYRAHKNHPVEGDEGITYLSSHLYMVIAILDFIDEILNHYYWSYQPMTEDEVLLHNPE